MSAKEYDAAFTADARANGVEPGTAIRMFVIMIGAFVRQLPPSLRRGVLDAAYEQSLHPPTAAEREILAACGNGNGTRFMRKVVAPAIEKGGA